MRGVFLLVLLGAADARRMKAFEQPIAMLETKLTEQIAKVEADGKKNAQIYNEFACVCKEKQEYYAERMGEKGGEIAKANAGLKDEKSTYEGHHEKRTEQEKDKATNMKDLDTEEDRGNTLLTHLIERIEQLESGKTLFQKAVTVLRNARNQDPSMIQLAVRSLAKKLWNKQPQDAYSNQSGDIMATLEDMQSDLTKELQDTRVKEQKARKHHEKEVLELRDAITMNNREIRSENVAMAAAMRSIGNHQTDLTVSGRLHHEAEHDLIQLVANCQEKKRFFDQSLEMRERELTDLHMLKTIITDYVAKQGADVKSVQKEAAADGSFIQMPVQQKLKPNPERRFKGFSQAVSLLQVRRTSSPFEKIVNILEPTAKKNPEMAMIMQAATKGDPFGKIRGLIRDMIKALEDKTAAEMDHNQKCTGMLADIKQRRDEANRLANDADAAMKNAYADFQSANSKLLELEQDHDEMMQTWTENARIRYDNHLENEEMLKDAKDGIQSVEKAMNILSNLQSEGKSHDKAGAENADNKEDQGDQQGMADIMGMMDVVLDQFKNIEAKTRKNEDDETKQFKDYTQESKEGHAEMKGNFGLLKKKRAGASEQIQQEWTAFKDATSTMTGVLGEWDEAKRTTCKDGGVSYDQRVAAREAEISALKEAINVLESQ